jgi:hypothetical protein
MVAILESNEIVYQSLVAAMFAERDGLPDLAELFVEVAVHISCDCRPTHTDQHSRGISRHVIELWRAAG